MPNNQESPDIGHNHQGTKASEYQHKQQPKDNKSQAFTVYQRFGEAYFARDYSPLGEHPASSSTKDPWLFAGATRTTTTTPQKTK